MFAELKKKTNLWLIFSFALVNLSYVPVQADMARINLETEHLLLFIEDSDCVFVRNGKHYNAIEARRHISDKYHYFVRHIQTAEHFIRFAATKSSLSGRAYSVICNNQEIPTDQWLQNELNTYRNNIYEDGD